MNSRFLILTRLFFRLGVSNIVRVIFYKLRLRMGRFERLMPSKGSMEGQLLFDSSLSSKALPENLRNGYIERADNLLGGYHKFFFSQQEFVGSPPNWRQWNESCKGLHWSKVEVNSKSGQDVKKSWDLSRFHWMPTFAAAYSVSNDQLYLNTINNWFSDWSECNAPNTGVNWVCAQEVSIRLINILNTANLLGVHNTNISDVFFHVVTAHCERVYPTIGYAVAQDNNHGISEASALFIAGNWLESFAPDNKRVKLGRAYSKLGRRVLERLLKRLVLSDGGFAMYSLTYHRVVLDTLSLVEYWREALGIRSFSKRYYQKASSLVDFLYQVHDLNCGDVPNLGANDGSRSYLLTDSDYRDFRPSLQLASGYFSKSRAYDYGAIEWYSATLPESAKPQWPQKTSLFKNSGFIKIIDETMQSWALVRLPIFRFRPAQSDALHVDLWWKGRNILTNSGSYSYNCAKDIDDYFCGAAGHNVVQFDERECMPRIGKFLWGEWLNIQNMSSCPAWYEEARWSCSYKDYLGACHHREIVLTSDGWLIYDGLSNFKSAKLRWHLEVSEWVIQGNTIQSDDVKIIVHADGPIFLQLCRGWKSLYYGQRTEIPILEVTVESSPINITTEIKLIN